MKQVLEAENILLATLIELNTTTILGVKRAVERINRAIEDYPESTSLKEFREPLMARYRELRAEQTHWETGRDKILRELKRGKFN